MTRAYPVWEATQAEFVKIIGKKDLLKILGQRILIPE